MSLYLVSTYSSPDDHAASALPGRADSKWKRIVLRGLSARQDPEQLALEPRRRHVVVPSEGDSPTASL